jgi:hypothetical protein
VVIGIITLYFLLILAQMKGISGFLSVLSDAVQKSAKILHVVVFRKTAVMIPCDYFCGRVIPFSAWELFPPSLFFPSMRGTFSQQHVLSTVG